MVAGRPTPSAARTEMNVASRPSPLEASDDTDGEENSILKTLPPFSPQGQRVDGQSLQHNVYDISQRASEK